MAVASRPTYLVNDHETRPYDMVVRGVVRTNWCHPLQPSVSITFTVSPSTSTTMMPPPWSIGWPEPDTALHVSPATRTEPPGSSGVTAVPAYPTRFPDGETYSVFLAAATTNRKNTARRANRTTLTVTRSQVLTR